jgi:predicted oxidoreductase
MEPTTTITIPSSWLGGQVFDQEELHRALQLGLAQLRQQQAAQETKKVVQAMLSTGRIRHLAVAPTKGVEREATRQQPPILPGPPVSEILIAQRRGEL